jgi:ankyrin repeat protein
MLPVLLLTLVAGLAAAAPPALPPMMAAARDGDAVALERLMNEGVSVRSTAPDGSTALHWAAHAGHTAIVTRLLAAGADAGAVTDLGVTPLHVAAAAGQSAIVQQLLASGASAMVLTEGGIDPLMEAARVGDAAAVRALLEAGADPTRADPMRGQTALMWAAAGGHHAAVEALVAKGAAVHARSRTRPLVVMVDRGPSRSVKTSGQDAQRLTAGGLTPLLFAALSGDVPTLDVLLAHGASPDDVAGDGRSALVLAAFDGHGAASRRLIAAGADVQADGAGYTALHAAVLRGDEETVRALLARGANVNARLRQGSPVRRFGSQWALSRTLRGATPLMVAVAYLDVALVRVLLAAGADPSLGLADGHTPLMLAAGAGVEREARPSDLVRWNVTDADTPQIPRDRDEVEAVVLALLDAGASARDAGPGGQTALHLAAADGHVGVIRVLVARGAVVDAQDAQGQTPLSLTQPRPAQPGRAPARAGQPEAEAALRALAATRPPA